MSNFDFLPASDDLDDVLTAPARTGQGAAKASAAAAVAYGHKESCPKCRGTGRFTSYSGRVLGECFSCKGVGSKTFKTSAPARAAARENAASRKVDQAAARLEQFAVEHPAIAQWFAENPTFEFATSLKAGVEKYGSLTEKQTSAVYRCIEKAAARTAERTVAAAARAETAPTVDSSKLDAAFAAASTHIRRPKIRIGGLVISPAPATGKNAGSLYVKRAGVDGEYLGKVTSGRFLCTSECDAEAQATVVSVINDPAAAAKAHGLKSGSCSCCGRELTDPVSVAAGIGPICAERFGW